LPALSPFVAVLAAISVRAVGVLTLLAVPVLLLVLAFPRWFCRWGCPVGLLQEWVAKLRPNARKSWRKWPVVGQWLLLLTLGGALLGYPLFLWLDPLAIFNGCLNSWRQPIAVATLVTGLGLPALLLLEWAMPQVWCRRICPLGATQDALAGLRRGLRAKSGEGGQDRFAKRGRRQVLVAIAGAAGGFAVKTVRGQSPPLLRPPGSLDETQFTGVCVRCGNCAQVCPSKVIQPELGSSGAAGFLAPQLVFHSDYCREDCFRCTQVCPSGAISRIPLAEKRCRMIGLAVVDASDCLLAQGRECTACIQKCPYQAIVMYSSDGGFSNEPAVIADRCNGCGACEAVCPVRPTRAIRIHQRRGILADHMRKSSPR
jgi:ferredoxin-type protein NapF